MTKGEINPRHVGKVDQDLAAARSNLTLHIADFRRMLDQGETTEVVFLHFAQTMLRETNQFHTAIMFSAAVLTLVEESARGFPADHFWLGDLSGFSIEQGPDDGSGCVELHHRCGWHELVEPADQYLGNMVTAAMGHRAQGCL